MTQQELHDDELAVEIELEDERAPAGTESVLGLTISWLTADVSICLTRGESSMKASVFLRS